MSIPNYQTFMRPALAALADGAGIPDHTAGPAVARRADSGPAGTAGSAVTTGSTVAAGAAGTTGRPPAAAGEAYAHCAHGRGGLWQILSQQGRMRDATAAV